MRARFFSVFFKSLANVTCLGVIAAIAAEPAPNFCGQTLFDNSYKVFIEGSFVNKVKSRVHTSIQWNHHAAAPDSFHIVFPNESSDTILFTTDGSRRRLKFPVPNSDGEFAERGMATHHLRENIGNSPLVYDDLDLLANGQFLCPDSAKPKDPNPTAFATAFSQTWFHLTADQNPEPTSLKMTGTKGHRRMLQILSWNKLGEIKLPTAVRITGNNYYGMVWIHSAYAIGPNDDKATEDPLLKFVVPQSETALVLELDNELLPNATIVESILATSKDARSDSDSLGTVVKRIDDTGKGLGIYK